MPLYASWQLHSYSFFAHLRKSRQISSKVCKYSLAYKRDVQITGCECNQQNATNVIEIIIVLIYQIPKF